ncbi:MAG: hypothetical protein Tp1124DCM108671_20 [Prokaryotic dsDNA virus sp.]|nr:MAG: hypothetical protein Tp1125DCM102451_40 [Prokaryotic dsDNA virus sp.]QDP65577.1 MAG: hypothetical protein Tp1124DCM108671_20 [Prokaryotic dsDNA virus sp.]|tara:strand:- start:8441 stop:11422 length:2982 start_codon:yes stop_codon:yes gene_type:complete
MAVQLILYPQTYNGQYTSDTVNNAAEMVTDGQQFNSYSSASSAAQNGTMPIHNFLQATGAAIGGWSSYHSTGTGTSSTYATTTAITRSGGNLVLPSANVSSGIGSVVGIAQRVQGLSVAQQYEVKVEITVSGTTGAFDNLGFQKDKNCWSVTPSGWTSPIDSVSINGLGGGQGYCYPVFTTTVVWDFYALATEEVFHLDYYGDNGATVTINSISIKAMGILDHINLEDGQVICDLYEEASIPLNLSIDNFKNVAERVSSFSKSFDLPATKRNNQIFSNLFDTQTSIADDIYSFNPYVRTKAILKEDSFTIFEGNLKLVDIKEKKGQISYNVNLFSDVQSLKDVISNKTFQDIDFSELAHEYTAANIEKSWTGILDLENALVSGSFAGSTGATTTDVLKYPFCDWSGQFTYNGHINANTGLLETPSINVFQLRDAFRPWINCKYLLDRIMDEAGYYYESSFLNTTDFTKLYMDFNWGTGAGPISGSNLKFTVAPPVGSSESVTSSWAPVDTSRCDFTPHGVNFCSEANQIYNSGTHRFTTIAAGGQLWFGGTVVFYNSHSSIGYANVKIRIKQYDSTMSGKAVYDEQTFYLHDNAGASQYSATAAGNGSLRGMTVFADVSGEDIAVGDIFRVEVQAPSTNIKILDEAAGLYIAGDPNYHTYVQWETVGEDVDAVSLLNGLRGEMNQWEFVNGLIKSFNLVVLQSKTEANTLKIEPYNDLFISNTSGTTLEDRSIIHDWTDKVDMSEVTLKPLDLKKLVEFRYAKAEDSASKQYTAAPTVPRSYGDYDRDYGTTHSLLTGKEKITNEPFAATIIKPIFDPNINTVIYGPCGPMIIPTLCSANDDNTEFSDGENAPRILYDNGVRTLGANDCNYRTFPEGTGGTRFLGEKDYLLFTHFKEFPFSSTTVDMNWGACPLINIPGSTVNNLYNVYYASYFHELYDPDTRILEIKINLNAADISQFNFNELVFIKNKHYRVNKIQYNPTALSRVELILIG